MNKFNKRGLVALILFHTLCREQKKRGQPYLFDFNYVRLGAIIKSKDSDMLSLNREQLIKKAKKAKGRYPWSTDIHFPMMGLMQPKK